MADQVKKAQKILKIKWRDGSLTIYDGGLTEIMKVVRKILIAEGMVSLAGDSAAVRELAYEVRDW